MKELYDEDYLIDRICGKIKKTERFRVDPLDILFQNGKTFIRNFSKICDQMGRDKSLIKIFLENEKKYTMSILASGTLSIDGRQKNNDIEIVLNKFINEYVKCPEPKCKSGKTTITKIGKMHYLICQTCTAKKTITPID